MIGGIVQVPKFGRRWTDAPRDLYGLKMTLYNRFLRWAAREGAGSRCFGPWAQPKDHLLRC